MQLNSCSTISRVVPLLLIITVVAISATAQTRTFTVKNNCSETVWVAGSGSTVPVFNGTSSGGIELLPGATATTTVPDTWSAGRIWGRRNCTFDSSGKGSCATGDCGGVLNCTHSGAGNTTLTEWTLSTGPAGDNYDISLVDAFDFPVSIQLDDPSPNHCVNPACSVDLRSFCTGDQRTLDSSGNVVGCKSLFGKFGTPNYGCFGPYGVPASCNNVSWNTNFRGTVVKKFCPPVYGYPYDDPSSDIACFPPPATGYIVTFCPASTVPNADPTVTPTFTITSTNDGQTVTPGNSVTYNFKVTASSTFTGTVAMSVHDLPSSCTWSGGSSSCKVASTATISPASVSLTPNAVVPVAVTIHANTNPAPSLQTSGLEVMGKSGALQNVWEGQITVADPTAPDYTLQVSPNTPQTIQPGGSIVYNLTLTPVNGFNGTVTLASFVNVPGTVTFNPATITLSGAGSQTATLTVASSSTAAKKTYYPLITTYSGNRLHDFQANLTLAAGGTPDFTIAATPGSQSVVAGNSTTYTVSVSPHNGFTGNVSLAVSGLPPGATANLNPASISGSGTSTLTVTTATSTPIGNDTLTITGTSGSLSHPASVVLSVNSLGGTPVQINCGGPTVSPFVADKDFAGGATINHANTIDLSGVTNPAPMVVYQTGRDGNFTYTIPGFNAGASHTVRLHFAETFFAAAGSRTFNVSINGTQVLANFDIFAAAGAKNKAVIKQFTANADSNGQFVIVFTSVVNNSLVSGIEVQ